MPEEDAELGDDFAYILRMADSDIDGLKPIAIGLTSIKGVGLRTSQQICRLAGINGKTLGGHLSEEEQDSLRSAIDDYATTVPWWLVNRQRDLGTNEDAHIVAMEVKMTRDDDISRMAGIKAYRGMRHRSGHKVRGQRLRSNGRKGSSLGVEKKKIVEKKK
jgi:small subunit ribosomal protein S13